MEQARNKWGRNTRNEISMALKPAPVEDKKWLELSTQEEHRSVAMIVCSLVFWHLHTSSQG